MPNGRVHSAATVILATVEFAAILAAFDPDPNQLWAIPAGCMAGILLSPDLDVDGGNISVSHVRGLGKIPAFLWRVFWFPYALAIPHRSILSHGFIIGTALRLLYLSFFLTTTLLLLKQAGLDFTGWALDVVGSPWFWHGVLGLATSDVLHTIMDGIE
jgi:uncharacterized metal-binding protein